MTLRQKANWKSWYFVRCACIRPKWVDSVSANSVNRLKLFSNLTWSGEKYLDAKPVNSNVLLEKSVNCEQLGLQKLLNYFLYFSCSNTILVGDKRFHGCGEVFSQMRSNWIRPKLWLIWSASQFTVILFIIFSTCLYINRSFALVISTLHAFPRKWQFDHFRVWFNFALLKMTNNGSIVRTAFWKLSAPRIHRSSTECCTSECE